MQQEQQLDKIFQLQDDLNSRFGKGQKEIMILPEAERIQIIRDYTENVIIEAGEVLKASGARWWKFDKDYSGMKHIQEEIIDCFHFLISAFLATGGTVEDFYKVYKEKNNYNHVRPDWQINNGESSKNNTGSI